MNKLTHVSDEPGITHWQFVDTKTDLSPSPPKNERRFVQSLVISDVHFGTTACSARALLAMLNTFWVEKYLILNGDIFHDLNFSRISGAQWKVLSRIRKLTDPDISLEEVWIRGNHDNLVIDVYKHLIGIDVKNEFTWECAGKHYLAIHGDQFDRFIIDFPGITKFIIWLHGLVQRIDPNHRHIGGWLSRKSGEWRRESETVAERAIRYGKESGVDVITCGHTHLAMRRDADGVTYLNSGSWVQNPCSFVTITDAGPILNFIQLS